MVMRVFLLILLFVLTGCSQNLKVTGTVTFSDDGSPLPHGAVVFETKAKSFMGRLDKQGRYSIGVEKDGTGIPPGNYKVWLTSTDLEKSDTTDPESESVITTQTVDLQYTTPDNSPLSFEVRKNGPRKFDFVVDRPQPADESKRE
ncbi:MAG: carboxypeptidase-like regulatory domain-containing protein [Planctomycetaceae bacterium]|nr:carboxypeptidase-like regulatory domain-containing protein [Planctomycetaceae bacterium]